MSAPASHIVFADKIFTKFFPDKDRAAFLVGTSFPDIRYLGVIDRDKTHFPINELSEVEDESSFITGMRFHALLDSISSEYRKSTNMHSLFPDSKFISQAVKFWEDKILYNTIGDWEEIRGFFEVVYEEEKLFGIKDEDLRKWHTLLQSYLIAPTTDIQIQGFLRGVNEVGMSDEVVRVLKDVKDETKARELIGNFYTIFDDLISF